MYYSTFTNILYYSKPHPNTTKHHHIFHYHQKCSGKSMRVIALHHTHFYVILKLYCTAKNK